jgi:hypothetical protein
MCGHTLGDDTSRARSTPSAPKEPIVSLAADQTPGFETEIKPLFRAKDRESMQRAFDLWSHDDVSQHADAILGRLEAGSMPCDGAWPEPQVELFRRWTEGGKPQ